MTTLYNRATPPQQRVLRAVAGAYKNACDAHPQHRYDHRFARSIAKRATGTLTAQWPDVLAAKAPSKKSRRDTATIASAPDRSASKRSARGPAQVRQQPPLRRFRIAVGVMTRAARNAGHVERQALLVEILRLLAACEAGTELRGTRRGGASASAGACPSPLSTAADSQGPAASLGA